MSQLSQPQPSAQPEPQFAFNALLARQKYIGRWGLMRATRTETLSEHTADVCALAHMLCLLSVHLFGTDVRCETVTVAALYHDASEILTGDMPTPVKYKTEALRAAYKKLEKDAADSLAELAPEPVRAALRAHLREEGLTEKERQLLKAADRLSALIKCIEEGQSGNREFAGAQAQQTHALHAMHCAEAEYFMAHMLPCYTMTLDELSRE